MLFVFFFQSKREFLNATINLNLLRRTKFFFFWQIQQNPVKIRNIKLRDFFFFF